MTKHPMTDINILLLCTSIYLILQYTIEFPWKLKAVVLKCFLLFCHLCVCVALLCLNIDTIGCQLAHLQKQQKNKAREDCSIVLLQYILTGERSGGTGYAGTMLDNDPCQYAFKLFFLRPNDN